MYVGMYLVCISNKEWEMTICMLHVTCTCTYIDIDLQ